MSPAAKAQVLLRALATAGVRDNVIKLEPTALVAAPALWVDVGTLPAIPLKNVSLDCFSDVATSPVLGRAPFSPWNAEAFLDQGLHPSVYGAFQDALQIGAHWGKLQSLVELLFDPPTDRDVDVIALPGERLELRRLWRR
jgi:hypothetical protein